MRVVKRETQLQEVQLQNLGSLVYYWASHPERRSVFFSFLQLQKAGASGQLCAESQVQLQCVWHIAGNHELPFPANFAGNGYSVTRACELIMHWNQINS